MISICRIALPLDLQDFYLAFPSINIPFARALNQVLKGLILSPQWVRLRTGTAGEQKLQQHGPFGVGVKYFWI